MLIKRCFETLSLHNFAQIKPVSWAAAYKQGSDLIESVFPRGWRETLWDGNLAERSKVSRSHKRKQVGKCSLQIILRPTKINYRIERGSAQLNKNKPPENFQQFFSASNRNQIEICTWTVSPENFFRGSR